MEKHNEIPTFLYWSGVGIPVFLVFVTAIARSLVQNAPLFRWRFWFLGIDLTFSGMTAMLLNILDLLKDKDVLETVIGQKRMAITCFGLVADFALLLVVLKIHQQWEPEDKVGKMQVVSLGFASNLVGGATILVFAYMKFKTII